MSDRYTKIGEGSDEHTYFEAVTYPEAERPAMTLQEKIAARPPYVRTMGELAAIEGESSAIRLMILQNEALHVYNALLCEALRILMAEEAEAAAHYDIVDGLVLNDCRAVLAVCEVKL